MFVQPGTCSFFIRNMHQRGEHKIQTFLIRSHALHVHQGCKKYGFCSWLGGQIERGLICVMTWLSPLSGISLQGNLILKNTDTEKVFKMFKGFYSVLILHFSLLQHNNVLS